MELSFKEKRSLQQDVESQFDALGKADISFRDRRECQKKIELDYSKLTGESDGSQEKSLFDRLVAGEFIKETPLKFYDILKKCLDELGVEVKSVIEPVVEYLKAHFKPTEHGFGVFESANKNEIMLNTEQGQ